MSPRRALPAAAFVLVSALGAAAWPFTVDDAFVLARYARRIASGAGYTMNDGPPTDGVTGPLALVPALLGELAIGDPVAVSKAFGIGAAALAALLVVRRAARSSTSAAVVTLLLASCGATLPVWAAAGLETGLATLGLTVAALAVTSDTHSPARAGITTGVSICALAWLRPELAFAALVLLVALLRSRPRAGAIALALAIIGLVSVVAFRLALFGAPLPLSVQAKPPDLANGAGYVLRGVIVALGGGGMVVAWLGAREGSSADRVLFAVLVAHLLALVLAGGDWMPGFRLFAPVLPLYALLASRSIASRLQTPGRRVRAFLLLAACGLIPPVDLVVQLPAVRDAGEARERGGAELADWLARNAKRVAMVDIGYAAYRSAVEVVDLGGITDPRIGTLPGGHVDKHIDPGLLRALAPDVVVLHTTGPPAITPDGRLLGPPGHPVERRVAAMPWVRAEMRVVHVVPYAPHYVYVVLARRPP